MFPTMKKILYNIFVATSIFSVLSCGDMLDTESTRELVNPTISEKTDSVVYATGVLQALQRVADQYYFANELRGELVTTTDYTEEALREIAGYKVSTETVNKYDSVYLYYNVINNCNYYLEHRDSAIYSGSQNVSRDEYISVAAVRAWTYMQMARLYEKVPYVTKSLTTISAINNDDSPVLTGKEILAKEKSFLQGVISNFYSSSNNGAPLYRTTTFGISSVDVGNTNWGTKKYVNPKLCFMPVDVVLGDICLELDQFDEAARYYFTYLNNEADLSNNYTMTTPAIVNKEYISIEGIPSDYVNYSKQTNDYLNSKQGNKKGENKVNWYNIFKMEASPKEVVSYIPMAVNYTRGLTTSIPSKYGFDFYASSGSRQSQRYVNNCPQTDRVEILPSKEYNVLADTAHFYYQNAQKSGLVTPISSARMGDARSIVVTRGNNDTTVVYNEKVSAANIYIYRLSTIYLRLAEALNRQGYPDLAFAILKDGLNADLKDFVATPQRVNNPSYYIKESSYNYLLSLGGFRNSKSFDVRYQTKSPNEEDAVIKTVGIHMHGCGMVDGIYSPYQYKTVVGDKLAYLNEKFGLNMTTTNLNDTINAMEDIICDEMALELAFEGCRYSDLQRIAHHKNNAGLYGAAFGSRWLGKKLVSSGRKDITDENMFMDDKNWFLPFNY